MPRSFAEIGPVSRMLCDVSTMWDLTSIWVWDVYFACRIFTLQTGSMP